MKEYPLEIKNVGEDVYIVMSKGHHDPGLFMQAVEDAGYAWPLGNPEHVWIKSTPCKTGDFNTMWNIVKSGTRGLGQRLIHTRRMVTACIKR